MSSLMASELERLAKVAAGHGAGDPAVDVFLVFVGALDPLPDAESLRPAAHVIGKLRLAQALDRPGDPRLGACRLLAAVSAEAPPRHVMAQSVEVEPPPPATGRRIPDLFEALLAAVRAALSVLV